MSKVKTVGGMVSHYLHENGFDGLAGDECGCDLNDLMPCGSDDVWDCMAAYRVKYNPEIHGECDADPGDWIYSTVKPTERGH